MKILKDPFTLVGASLIMGEVGKGLDSAPLQQAGATTAKFIAPVVNINMAGFTVKQLKGLKKL